jgi:hypothetical protein
MAIAHSQHLEHPVIHPQGGTNSLRILTCTSTCHTAASSFFAIFQNRRRRRQQSGDASPRTNDVSFHTTSQRCVLTI